MTKNISRFSPRIAVALATTLTTALALSACGGQREAGSAGTGEASDSCDAGTGRINIATGNTTGVYYVVGGGLAKLINSETKLQATAAETGASVQNIQQLAAGDYDIAFSLADTAVDAVKGDGAFDGAQKVSTLGRIYPNYTQVVVRADSGIESIGEFKGKRISTGSPQSGTEVIAKRMIQTAGLKESDVKAQRLDLTKTVDGMKDGSIDGLVWSGGLPTPAMTDLFTSMGDRVKFIDPTPLLPELQKISPVYEAVDIPAKTYGLDKDAPSIAVPNVLMVRDDMPDNLACALTTLTFEKKDELVKVHPAAADIEAALAGETYTIPVHPGSKRALESLGE